MKIFYDHVISKQADTDFNYTLISAWVDSGEEDEALATGWLPTYFYTDDCEFAKESEANKRQIWCQLRSARIECEKFRAKNKHLKALKLQNFKYQIIKQKDIYRDLNVLSTLYQIYNKYVTYKNYKDILDKDGFIKHIIDDSSHFILFMLDDRIVACTAMQQFGNSFVSGLFFWDYANKELSLGNLSNHLEVELSREYGFKYLYIGVYSEIPSQYKSYIKGVQVWTGRKWMSNKRQLINIAQNDSSSNTLEDFVDYDKFQKLLDF
jgi:arginyl-tRNA--protein-N-Asp/Glu arginylyltransferase